MRQKLPNNLIDASMLPIIGFKVASRAVVGRNPNMLEKHLQIGRVNSDTPSGRAGSYHILFDGLDGIRRQVQFNSKINGHANKPLPCSVRANAIQVHPRKSVCSAANNLPEMSQSRLHIRSIADEDVHDGVSYFANLPQISYQRVNLGHVARAENVLELIENQEDRSPHSLGDLR